MFVVGFQFFRRTFRSHTLRLSSSFGNLKRTSSTELFAYVLKYDGATLDLASTVVQNHASAAAVAVNKDVTISYTGIAADLMVAGDYTDTVTFSIAAN